MQIDVEVLRAEVQHVRSAVSDIGAKMDILLALQAQIVRLQEKHDNATQAIDRAFKSLKEVKDLAESTHDRFAAAKSFFRGALFVSFVLFGFAQWYVLQQLGALDELAKKATNFDIRVTLLERRSSGGNRE